MQTARHWRALGSALPLLGLVFVAMITVLIIGVPRELIDFRTAYGLLRILAWVGIGGAVLAIAVAIASPAARLSALAGLALFSGPVITLTMNEATPPPGGIINDVTTDLADPPRFSAVIPLRPADANPIEYGGDAVAAVQRRVHPEVQPLYSELDEDAAFQRAFETAEALGWEIIAADKYAGTIEAVDTTLFFRFRDDVIIRISATPNGTRIDLRSRSRVGRSDLGKNAARIIEFSQRFERP